MKQIFLDWDKPLLYRMADYLIDHHTVEGCLNLKSVTLVMQGQRALRRLEEILAERAAKMDDPAWYPPELLTLESLPEKFYEKEKPIAPEITRWFAWIESIQKLHNDDPVLLKNLLPDLPKTFSAWITLGRMLARLHYELAADGIDFQRVAAKHEFLGTYGEIARWKTLSVLQSFYANADPAHPGFLDQCGLWDVQAARLFAIERQTDAEYQRITQKLKSDHRQFYLVGLVDMNDLQKRILKKFASFITAIVFAPETLGSRFDEFGCLRANDWCDAPIEIDEKNINIVWQPENEADAVLRKIASLGGTFATGAIIVGVPDKQVIPFVQEHLAKADLPSRLIEGMPVRRTAVYRFLEVLLQFLKTRQFRDYAELVRHPDVEQYVRQNVDHAVAHVDYISQLDDYHNTYFPASVDDEWKNDPKYPRKFETLPLVWKAFGQLLEVPFTDKTHDKATPKLLRDQLTSPLPFGERVRVRGSSVQGDTALTLALSQKERGQDEKPIEHWLSQIDAILDRLYRESQHRESQHTKRLHEQDNVALDIVNRTVKELRSLPAGLPQQFTFAEALELLLTQIEMEPIAPPELPNAIELIGWLDMAMDDAPVAIVTGMNDGIVPSFANADIFLPDTLRQELGVMDNRRRCARDAYALTVLLETRKYSGEVLLVAGRRSTEGDPMLPSRFFFMEKNTETTARRVREFFADMKPEAAVRLKRSLQPGCDKEHGFHIPVLPDLPKPIESFSVTELAQYLRCPYRYYLSRLRGFRKKDDSIEELQRNHFGTLVHDILQRFGAKESPVRDSVSPKAIREFLNTTLEEYAEQMYGKHPRATLAIQVERARARLHAFADWQAGWRHEGYEIGDVEFGPDKEHPVKMAGMILSGRIDRIDRHPEKREVVVFDYKTGTATPDGAYHQKNGEWFDFQLPLYYYILRQSGYATSEETIRLGYLSIPADTQELDPKWAPWNPEEIQSGIVRAEQLIHEILNTDWKTVEPSELPHKEQQWDDFAAICMCGLR